MGKDGLFKKWGKKLRHKFGKKLNPNTVTAGEAIRWYEDRRDGYEEMARQVAPYIPKNGVYYDIGANVGFFSRVLAQVTGFSGRAFLFEPHPNLALVCEKAMEGFPCETKVFAYGLGDKDLELDLHISTAGNLGWNTFISEQATPDMEKVRVKVKIFDRTGLKTKPAFIKIDVEGSEYQVIAGMMKSLAAWKPKPVILSEMGWGKKHPHWKKQVAVFSRLLKLGYSLHRLDGTKIGLDGVHEESVTTDYLLLPKGRRFVKVN